MDARHGACRSRPARLAPVQDSSPTRSSTAFTLGFLLVLGWTLHDVAVFALSGRPALVLSLLLPSLAMALAGGVLAVLLCRSRALLVGFAALCAALAVLPLVRSVALPRALLWLPRAALLLTLAGVLVVLSRRRGPRPSLVTAALAAGVLACLVKTLYRQGWMAASTPVAVGLALALGTAWSARPALRRGGAVLGLLLCSVWLGWKARPALTPSRPDLPPPSAAPPQGASDLLLIVLDTVRADHLGCYGYERDTTPKLDARVERDFTRFTSARSTSSWTLPSHASLFTGLHVSQHGTNFANPFLRDDVVTLAEMLQQRGYATAAFTTNDWVNEKFGFNRGFESFRWSKRTMEWLKPLFSAETKAEKVIR